MKKLLGWGAVALVVLFFTYNSGSSSSTTGYSEPDYDAIVESSVYQDLEAELEDAKDCINTLTDQLDNIRSTANSNIDGDYETINDTLNEISSNSDPDCSI